MIKWRASGKADERWLREWRSTSEDMEGVCRRAYGLGQADQIFDDEVDDLLMRMGLVVNEHQKRQLAIAVAKAKLPAIQTVLQRLDGEIIETRDAISSIAKSLNVMTREEADKVAVGHHPIAQEGLNNRLQSSPASASREWPIVQ